MLTILVVDDEPDVPLLFQQRFRHEIRAGALAFVFARSGEEALACLAPGRPGAGAALVLADLNMPGMGGLELLRRLGQAPAPPGPPPVLVITANGDPGTRQRAHQLGARALLAKPLNFAALRQQLGALAAA